MISFKKAFSQKLILDPFDLEPYGEYDTNRALKRIKKLGYKPVLLGKQKTYQFTDKDIERMNKESYKSFTQRLEIMEKSKQKYDARKNS